MNQGDESKITGNKYAWYVVILLMVAYIFSFIDRQILTLLIEHVKHDLNISDTQFSLLTGFAFSLFYALMGPPIAYLADRYSRVRIISVGITFWSLATIACGLSKNFLQIFLSRVGVGSGEAALTPATYSMLSDMFPKEKLGRAVGTYSMGAFLGGGLALLAGGFFIGMLDGISSIDLGPLGAVRSWQMVFFLAGVPGIAIAAIIWMTVREPRNRSAEKSSEFSISEIFQFISKNFKAYSFVYIGFSFFAICQYALMNWTPALYMRKFALSSTEVGYILGTILLLFSTAGVFCGGWLTDALQKRQHQDAAMISGALGAALMLPSAVGAALASDLKMSIMFLIPAMFFSSFPLSTSAAAIQILTPKHLRAQATSLFLLVSNIIGMGIGTTLVALVTDGYFKDSNAVDRSLGGVIGFAAIVCVALLGIGRKHFRESVNRQAANGG